MLDRYLKYDFFFSFLVDFDLHNLSDCFSLSALTLGEHCFWEVSLHPFYNLALFLQFLTKPPSQKTMFLLSSKKLHERSIVCVILDMRKKKGPGSCQIICAGVFAAESRF